MVSFSEVKECKIASPELWMRGKIIETSATRGQRTATVRTHGEVRVKEGKGKIGNGMTICSARRAISKGRVIRSPRLPHPRRTECLRLNLGAVQQLRKIVGQHQLPTGGAQGQSSAHRYSMESSRLRDCKTRMRTSLMCLMCSLAMVIGRAGLRRRMMFLPDLSLSRSSELVDDHRWSNSGLRPRTSLRLIMPSNRRRAVTSTSLEMIFWTRLMEVHSSASRARAETRLGMGTELNERSRMPRRSRGAVDSRPAKKSLGGVCQRSLTLTPGVYLVGIAASSKSSSSSSSTLLPVRDSSRRAMIRNPRITIGPTRQLLLMQETYIDRRKTTTWWKINQRIGNTFVAAGASRHLSRGLNGSISRHNSRCKTILTGWTANSRSTFSNGSSNTAMA